LEWKFILQPQNSLQIPWKLSKSYMCFLQTNSQQQ
jgi:hypothetical protein